MIFLLALPLMSSSQEVVISDFPIGVGGSVDDSFFEPYYSELQVIADTLNYYPLLQALVSGGADGETFRQNNDAKNPALALGRAHALKNILSGKFDVDSSQITI